jgi:hypothetical protein
MSLTSSIAIAVKAAQAASIDMGAAQARRAISVSQTLTDGVAAGNADRVFADTRTLAASGTEDLDLSGALTDAFGATVIFARVKAVAVFAHADNTNNVNVTRPASNGFPLFLAASDGIGLRPGEVFALAAGAADAVGHVVTAGTGDLLTITNAAGTTGVTYDIIVIGVSA